MPSNTSKSIRITLTGTGTVGGQFVKVVNRTTGEVHPTAIAFSSEKALNFDCAEFPSGWSSADVIEISTNGPGYGRALVTLTGDTKNQVSTIAATQESTTLPARGN